MNKRSLFVIFIFSLFFTPSISVGGIDQVDTTIIFASESNVHLKDSEFPDLTAKNMSTLLGLDDMWDMGYNGSGIKVAILDTGIDVTHDELVGSVIYWDDYTPNADGVDYDGHGTSIAGICGAKGVGSGKYQGVAPNVSLMNMKVLDASGSGDLEWVKSAIEDSVTLGADIISMSLGGEGGWSYIEGTVKNAWNSGVAVVVAAGNEGPDFGTLSSPGDVLEAISVGGISLDKYMLSFSSAGPSMDQRICKPEVVAPGARVIGPASKDADYSESFFDGGNEYSIQSGTSVATPVISGMVALLLEATNATPNAIKVALMMSGQDLIMDYSPYRQGYGVPSCIEAYNLLTDPEWIPALFLPKEMPSLPLDVDDVSDYPVTVLTGKKYEGAYFKTDLPIALPEIDGIDGHYLLEIEADLSSMQQDGVSEGYIWLMSAEDEELAELKVTIIPTTAFNIIILVIVGMFVVALTSIGAFMTFNFFRSRKQLDIPACDPKLDPSCKL